MSLRNSRKITVDFRQKRHKMEWNRKKPGARELRIEDDFLLKISEFTEYRGQQ